MPPSETVQPSEAEIINSEEFQRYCYQTFYEQKQAFAQAQSVDRGRDNSLRNQADDIHKRPAGSLDWKRHQESKGSRGGFPGRKPQPGVSNFQTTESLPTQPTVFEPETAPTSGIRGPGEITFVISSPNGSQFWMGQGNVAIRRLWNGH